MNDDWPVLPSLSGGRGGFSDLMAERLLAQRVVMLRGQLDELTVTRVSAELMTLDADGDDPVTLRVDCGEAQLGPALTLMDVVELMGVPVRAMCLGQVGGGAVGVVAHCSARAAMPSTRFALCEPSSGQTTLPARNVARWAELWADERERFCTRVAAAANQPTDRVREDVARGLFLSADDAVGYGLIDEVTRPDASIHQLPGSGSPMGFRPLR